MVAVPAVAVSKNCVNPPSFVMLGVPAVLVFMKFVNPPLLVMVAVPAVLALRKFVVPPLLLVIVVIPSVSALTMLKVSSLTTAPTIEPVALSLPSCSVPAKIVVPPL